jgi:hypothetical protein
LEDTITSAQHVPSEQTVQALREKLSQDTQVLASLDPNSDTHRRLAARVERQAAQLLDYEDQREHQRQAMQRVLVEQRRRDAEVDTRAVGFFGILIGGVIVYAAWGTWWLVLGIIFIVVGLCGLFANET